MKQNMMRWTRGVSAALILILQASPLYSDVPETNIMSEDQLRAADEALTELYLRGNPTAALSQAIDQEQYRIAVRLIEKEKINTLYAAYWRGKIYGEGLGGVNPDFVKGYRQLIESIRKHKSYYAAALLARWFWDGEVVSRNAAAAHRWSGLALKLGDINNVKDITEIKRLQPVLDLHSSSIQAADEFLQLRAQWLKDFPQHMRPFGIVLGEPLLHELVPALFNPSVSHPRLDSLGHVYVSQDSEELDNARALIVHTLPKTDAVYRVEAHYEFASEEACIAALDRYVEESIAGFDYVRRAYQPLRAEVWHVHPGVRSHGIVAVSPMYIWDLRSLEGLRISRECNGGRGQLNFLYLPLVQSLIAQTLASIPVMEASFGKEIANASHDHLNVFGLQILSTYPIVDATFEHKEYPIDAPNPEGFSGFGAQVSPLTWRLLSISAARSFSTPGECEVGRKALRNHLIRSRSRSTPSEIRTAVFYLTPDSATEDEPPGTRFDAVGVELRCDSKELRFGVWSTATVELYEGEECLISLGESCNRVRVIGRE